MNDTQTIHKAYRRVLPRDLFNEGNLLKCYGALWIALENHSRAKLSPEDVSSFRIGQSDDDGSTSIINVRLVVGGRVIPLFRPLNDRDPWPLYARFGDDEICVFDDNGDLSQEFWAEIEKNA